LGIPQLNPAGAAGVHLLLLGWCVAASLVG